MLLNTHIVVLVLVGATVFKKVQGSIVSNRIWMKFGRIVLQLNTHRLSEPDLRFDVTLSRWAAMTSFHTEKCCRLVTAHATSPRLIRSSVLSSWCTVRSYLLSITGLFAVLV